MEDSPADTLFLKGALQFDTALEALNTLDATSDAAGRLRKIRTAQKQLATAFPDEPERISIFLQGGNTADLKASIITGLEIMSASADTPERKIAAQALLEVMTQ